jgi:LAO/AO transport system kinase
MARQHYTSAMSLLRHTSFWTPRVMTCSALEGVNIDAVWGMVLDYYLQAVEEEAFQQKRSRQNRDWMHQLVQQMLMMRLKQNPAVKAMLPELERAVAEQEMTAYAAARQIMEQL